ncbi:MAG: PilZ domain-containing protein [Gammaproteobacteria bacterium]|nr:PilZ domain-containing protein [Gammaproteobacteria bacterium]MCP5300173.1 PilZ domain-containing protein [Chromatiaceae bacterium]
MRKKQVPVQTERRYIRHPSRMPIHFDLSGDVLRRDEYLRNVSEGGVCFACAVALDPGQPIRLAIPLLGQTYEVDGCVAWCRDARPGYEIGVRFLSPQDRFCVRMVEQLCYIEDYRSQVEREEGRRLSSEQAAEEWIARFAEQFPGLH